jgi:hypothetical protein
MVLKILNKKRWFFGSKINEFFWCLQIEKIREQELAEKLLPGVLTGK